MLLKNETKIIPVFSDSFRLFNTKICNILLNSTVKKIYLGYIKLILWFSDHFPNKKKDARGHFLKFIFIDKKGELGICWKFCIAIYCNILICIDMYCNIFCMKKIVKFQVKM